MTKIENDIEIIERFFNKQLTETDLADFEARKEEDKQLQELTKDLGIIFEGIRYSEREKLKKELLEFDKKMPDYEGKTKTYTLQKFNKHLAVAATLIIAFGLFFVLNPANSDSLELYSTYFETYPNVVNAVDRSEINDLTKELKAYYHYEAGNYNKAIDLFSELNANETDEYAQFYSAVSLMAVDEHNKAITILEELRKKEITINPQISWYLSLAYLKAEQFEKAQLLLNELAHGNSSYSGKAAEVSESINN